MKNTAPCSIELIAYTERVKVLIGNFPSTIIVNIVVALVYMALMWQHEPHWHLQLWMGLLGVSILLRIVMTIRCKRELNTSNARDWEKRFFVGAFTAGLIWGTAGIMFPLHDKPEYAVYFLGGLAAGAVAMNAALLRVYFAFVLTMLTPLTLYFFFIVGGAEGSINAGLIIFLTIVVSFAAWRYNQALHKALQLTAEQKRLSDEVIMHRDHLRELVDARTADLKAAKVAAENANRAKTDFMANMTHELRTPIHAIVSFSAIGQEQADQVETSRLVEYFGYIKESGQRLAKLVDNLLDLSKMGAGAIRLEWDHCELSDIVEKLKLELQGLLQEKQLRLYHQTDGANTKINCDAVRISQVLRNLISNAIRYSPAGGLISISYSTMEPAQQAHPGDGPAIRVTVADQGPGIPEPELEKIFDKFVQSSTTRSGAGGTGLGLAICKEIIQAHGGAISASNRAAGGAEFSFFLPFRACSPASEEQRHTTTKDAAS